MAFVGISNKLRDDVSHTIGKMCEAESKTVPMPDAKYTINNNNDWFVSKVWGEHEHLRTQIPADWKRSDHNYARFTVSTAEFGEFYMDVVIASKLDDLPPRYESYHAFQIDEADQSLPPLLREILDAKKARAEIEKRWNGIREQVLQFLNNCKSLNEALKLWPELEHYIPKDYIERVLEKRDRTNTVQSKAAEILSGIDTQGVMAAAVIARMSGATV